MPRVCPERMALLDSFIKAVSDYNQLQAAQIAALVRGEGFRFGREMRSVQKEVGPTRCSHRRREPSKEGYSRDSGPY